MSGLCLAVGFLCTIAAVGKVAAGAASSAVGDVVSSAWQQVCQSFADAATQMLKAFAAAFVAIPDVNLGSAGVRSVFGISEGLGPSDDN